MSDIVQFPPISERPPLLVGPFQIYKVVVDGRAIPGLTGFPDGEGQTALVVDGRFCATFPDKFAYQAAYLIANALAIGRGYSHLGATSKDQPFAPIIGEISAP